MTRLVSYIPDPPDRGAAFEPLLDDLAETFCQGLDLTAAVPGNAAGSRYSRCESKRLAIGRAAARDLDLVHANAALVLRAVVHDQCRSGNRQLVGPLVAALGYRPVQEALIGYAENGTDAEAIGATMAWYWARPSLVYRGTGNWQRRQPTAGSTAAWDALAPRARVAEPARRLRPARRSGLTSSDPVSTPTAATATRPPPRARNPDKPHNRQAAGHPRPDPPRKTPRAGIRPEPACRN